MPPELFQASNELLLVTLSHIDAPYISWYCVDILDSWKWVEPESRWLCKRATDSKDYGIITGTQISHQFAMQWSCFYPPITATCVLLQRCIINTLRSAPDWLRGHLNAFLCIIYKLNKNFQKGAIWKIYHHSKHLRAHCAQAMFLFFVEISIFVIF